MTDVEESNKLKSDLLISLELIPDVDVYEPKPFYFSLFETLEDYSKINRYFLFVIVSLLPFLFYYIISFLFNLDTNRFAEHWLKVNFSGWAFGTFLFMNYIYQKTASIYPYLLYLGHTPYNKYVITKLYDLMFISKSQKITCVATGILTTATGTYLGGFDLSIFPKLYIMVNSFFFGYILGHSCPKTGLE